MRFDLLSLKLFVAVCEHRNISRAADAESIAPSAISKRISHMEDMLKTPLFLRSNKGLELTPAAHSLLNHARVILRDLAQMESELFDHAEGLRGQIRLH
ncbi:MAG TPA: LysR family transcriptional regulator, partial [Bordetella sp.]|nr:LysR family transcriptional regulator [Bordetella sp.]